jgi:predicted nucleotidyltransferase
MLNPKLWDGKKLKPEVSKKLLEIALKFIEFLKIDVEPSDIIFTGSMASGAWTPQSDIDLHVVINFSEIDDEEFVKEYFMAKKAI